MTPAVVEPGDRDNGCGPALGRGLLALPSSACTLLVRGGTVDWLRVPPGEERAAHVLGVEADGGASPVLVAVVGEFEAKLAKSTKHATGGLPDHDVVVELEQAGDSAKVAAEADAGLSSAARESVLAAHLAICKLKAGARRKDAGPGGVHEVPGRSSRRSRTVPASHTPGRQHRTPPLEHGRSCTHH